MTLLLRAIFKYTGKTNDARASETGLSGRANQYNLVTLSMFKQLYDGEEYVLIDGANYQYR